MVIEPGAGLGGADRITFTWSLPKAVPWARVTVNLPARRLRAQAGSTPATGQTTEDTYLIWNEPLE